MCGEGSCSEFLLAPFPRPTSGANFPAWTPAGKAADQPSSTRGQDQTLDPKRRDEHGSGTEPSDDHTSPAPRLRCGSARGRSAAQLGQRSPAGSGLADGAPFPSSHMGTARRNFRPSPPLALEAGRPARDPILATDIRWLGGRSDAPCPGGRVKLYRPEEAIWVRFPAKSEVTSAVASARVSPAR